MDLDKRYDFVLFFDVKDGNPNGDPDAGNLPRVDAETGNGLVTDVCLKRKVRNYIGLLKNEQPPYEIYVKEKAILNNQNARAYQALNIDLSKDEGKRKGGDKIDEARAWMCKNFYDVRTFGAVMSTGINCGQVRGPVQLTFARSVDQIVSSEHSITRMAVATEAEAVKQGATIRTMGRKFTVPYGLYRAYGLSQHLWRSKQVFLKKTSIFSGKHSRICSRTTVLPRGAYGSTQTHYLRDTPRSWATRRPGTLRSCEGGARD